MKFFQAYYSDEFYYYYYYYYYYYLFIYLLFLFIYFLYFFAFRAPDILTVFGHGVCYEARELLTLIFLKQIDDITWPRGDAEFLLDCRKILFLNSLEPSTPFLKL